MSRQEKGVDVDLQDVYNDVFNGIDGTSITTFLRAMADKDTELTNTTDNHGKVLEPKIVDRGAVMDTTDTVFFD